MDKAKIKAKIDDTISKIPAEARKILKVLKLSQEYYDILKNGKHLTKAGKYKGMKLKVTDNLPYGTMYVTIK